MSKQPTFEFAGRQVNRMGYGAMQLCGPMVLGPPRDRGEVVAVLRAAVDAGVNHIDTAWIYGPDVADELIREALHPYPPDLLIASKVGGKRDDSGAWLDALTPVELRAAAERSLGNLGLERLEVVNLSMPFVPSAEHNARFGELLDMMIELRDEGLIGAIGLSGVSLAQLQSALQRTDIACVQNFFNVTNRAHEELLVACGEHGIPFVPFFPTSTKPFGNPVRENPVVVATADRLGLTTTQIALAWLLQLAPHILLIPGTSSRAHLAENLTAADVQLDERAVMDLAGLA